MTALSAIAAAVGDDIAALVITVNKSAIVSLVNALLVGIVRYDSDYKPRITRITRM